jgi:pimeloyl-ACP methyl ester carboxylesterase
MPVFTRDHIRFHFLDSGAGLPFFWQHGLGGNAHLAYELFKPPPGFRLISFDARGHGRTHPAGDAAKFAFCTFAEDLRALMDHLRIQQAVVGGSSMGAGLALHLALRFPERVLGLVLSRPAWLDAAHPFEFGEELARRVPGAVFKEITSKSVSVIQHGRDVQRHLEGFLRRHFVSLASPLP